MDKGKELHAAIEDYIGDLNEGNLRAAHVAPMYLKHCEAVYAALNQYGINLESGKPEHSFACNGYGGKIDWHTDEIVIDFKTKDVLTETVKGKVKDKKLAWPENVEQLAAYGNGIAKLAIPRLINVYIGVEDMEIRIHEWSQQDALNGWKVFQALLLVWQIRNNYTGQNL
jgi:hypothetical protein